MTDISKLIEIAKKIDPSVGPTFDMARKSSDDDQMLAKLQSFFNSYEKALKIIKQHPGKNYQQIKESFDLNTKTHVANLTFLSAFVNDVLDKKGDLDSLAVSASRRIILADERLNKFYLENKQVDPAATSKEIATEVEKNLVTYFSNLKGKKLDRAKIIEDLTEEVTIMVVKKIQQIAGGK
jgi:hypothetical protein